MLKKTLPRGGGGKEDPEDAGSTAFDGCCGKTGGEAGDGKDDPEEAGGCRYVTVSSGDMQSGDCGGNCLNSGHKRFSPLRVGSS